MRSTTSLVSGVQLVRDVNKKPTTGPPQVLSNEMVVATDGGNNRMHCRVGSDFFGAKDRAAPVKDAPKATVVLDRLVRTGQAPMASVVLDFAGGRRDGPRRKAKLRAKKDLTAKVPRKQCALKAQLARLVGGGYVVEKRQVRKFLKY